MAGLGFVLASCAPASAADTFSGNGRAIDGDSLTVGATEVRLHGIDAPEFTQTCTRDGQPWRCGETAANELGKLVNGKQVRCAGIDIDEHQRTVARCSVGAIDVNRAMVASGYALAYRRYSFAYVSAEQTAKATKRGLWSGTFDRPSDVRHAAEDAQESRPARGRSSAKPVVMRGISSKALPHGNCRIKGNRNRKGQWIYHVPGMPYYARTVAEEIFCTEAEARAAGYRRARVR